MLPRGAVICCGISSRPMGLTSSIFYSPKAYHSRKGHVHDYSVKREKFCTKQEIWLFFDLRLRNGPSRAPAPTERTPAHIYAQGHRFRGAPVRIFQFAKILFQFGAEFHSQFFFALHFLLRTCQRLCSHKYSIFSSSLRKSIV